jgi:hypothetical protein
MTVGLRVVEKAPGVLDSFSSDQRVLRVPADRMIEGHGRADTDTRSESPCASAEVDILEVHEVALIESKAGEE